MIERDLKLLKYLEKFRVLSRDQVGSLVCSDTKNPSKTASNICKRLARDGYITIVPQMHDKQYLYMPNPTTIPIHSTRTNHFLKIADLYIQYNHPEHFDVEPDFHEDYFPDIYMTFSNTPIVVEVQLTQISDKNMQEKINGFMRSFYRGEHKARTLWIYSNREYKLTIEPGFQIINGLELDTAADLILR